MPSSCCVIGCKSRGNAQPGVVFFQLPLNKPGVLTQWLIVLDRRDWIPKPSSRICSLHFYPDDYIMKPNQSNPRLKPDAIPSIFPDLGGDEKEEEKKEELREEQESPKPIPKPKPVNETPKSLSNVPKTPIVNESPSLRPRRAPKVSSKMKDFILLDEIKKTPRQSPAVPNKKDSTVTEGDKAAQELLSILEDSNSLSGDEKVSKPRPFDIKKSSPVLTPSIKKPPTAVLPPPAYSALKPMPASVKKEREERAAEERGDSSPQSSKDLTKAAKPVPVAFRKTYFQVKNGNKVLFLSYADLNPVADMTKNNALFVNNSHALVKSVSAVENTVQEEHSTPQEVQDVIIIPDSEDLIAKEESSPINTPAKNDNNSIDVNENAISSVNLADDSHHEDSEVFDSDSGLVQLPEKGIASTGIQKISKNFKVTSPVKRKKRFKAVAEIVVRTDNTGQVPSVCIEKMTNLETPEAARKKVKLGNHVPASVPHIPVVAHFPPEITPQDAELLALSQRIAGTIKHMKLLDSVKGDTSKLTVLITTLPPVQENELLVIKKKDTITNIEEVQELRVTISSTTTTKTTTVDVDGIKMSNAPNYGVPIIGACTTTGNGSGGSVKIDTVSVDGENKIIEGASEAPPPSGDEPNNIQATSDEGKTDGAAPLQHDHTYISPSTKVAEPEPAPADEQSKETLSNSKPKLTEEEISFRSKAQKKLRFLKETVKRKNENIVKLKEKITFLEKSLREEKRMKRKLALMSRRRGGMDMAEAFEGDPKSDMQNEEDGDYSDEDGRGRSRSPITYICEPAIDVCEKQVLA